MRILWLLATLLSACTTTPAIYRQPEFASNRFDYVARYTALLQTGNLSEVRDFFVSLGNAKIAKAAACILPLASLQKKFEENPLSLAAHYYLLKCYESKDRQAEAAYHEAILLKIFTGMYADAKGDTPETAIPFLTTSDIQVSMLLADRQIVDEYFVLSRDAKQLLHVFLLADSRQGAVSRKYFSNARFSNRLLAKQLQQLASIVEYPPGLLLLQALEEGGNQNVAVALGDLYRAGRRAEQDFKKAAGFYEQASQHDSVVGKTRLAELYLSGKGVEQNTEHAIDLLLPGFEVHYPNAQIGMAALYKTGQGVEQDDAAYQAILRTLIQQLGEAEARTQLAVFMQEQFPPAQVQDVVMTLLGEAAQAGHAAAQLRLGQLYLAGYGRYPVDSARALSLLRQAASTRQPEALRVLAGVMDKQKQAAQAFDYYLQAAVQGDALAQAEVCWRYHKGEGTKAGLQKAIEWCRRGAAQADQKALYYYGTLLGLGFAAAENRHQSQTALYARAARVGLADAQMGLAVLALSQKDGGRLYEEWLKRAANNGFAQAQYELGHTYYYGTITKQDRGEAIHWLQRAADQGHVDAMLKLGQFFEASDQGQAARWYAKAVQQGSRVAAVRLKQLRQKRADKSLLASVASCTLYDAEEDASEARPVRIVDGKLTGAFTSVRYKYKNAIVRTSEIPAALGQRYELIFFLDAATDGAYEIKAELQHPPIQLEDGSVTTGSSRIETVTVKNGRGVHDFTWYFGLPAERVAGAWAYRLYYRDELIAEKTFTSYLPAE